MQLPYFFYLFLPTFFTPAMRTTLTITIALFLLVIAIIITIMPNLNLQQKFSYYALFHLVFSPFINYNFLAMLLALVMIIYIPFIKKNNRFYNFVKEKPWTGEDGCHGAIPSLARPVFTSQRVVAGCIGHNSAPG